MAVRDTKGDAMTDTTLVQIDNLLRFINSANSPQDMRCGFPDELNVLAQAAHSRRQSALAAGDMRRAAKAADDERRYIREMSKAGPMFRVIH